jgi:CRISPR/Cas system-associated exonuclease Cas4 (RecB family)
VGASPRSYTTPSDLAEYAYCPRARHFRQELGDPPTTASMDAGTSFHATTLKSVRRRADHGRLLLIVALVGAVLVVVGLLGWIA